MIELIYKGTDFPQLIGKKALLSQVQGDFVFVQFNDLDTKGFAFGQHMFRASDFDPVPEVDWR
ncbi:MAG TPA: hypothetical protein VNW93_05360 [Mycobacterium sp.]|jgi:hypothetical protein|nr:hypothetical protein [Mycobacterium sp.]